MLFFTLALEYAIRKVQENEWRIMGLISSWSMVTMLIQWTRTVRKNTEAVLEAGTEIGRKVKTEKSKYMSMSHHQNHNLLMADKLFENVEK